MIIDASSTTVATSEEKDWQKDIFDHTKKLIELQTWRKPDDKIWEKTVLENLGKIKKIFQGRVKDFNDKSPVKIREFEWKTTDNKYWVFGFRAGKGPRKVSFICHLDTVPPGNNDWQPFKPRKENRLYNGVPTPFLIGRGAIDDKGPAVVAFEAFTRALEQASKDSKSLNALDKKVTFEVLFDTSEETDMSTPKYFEANPTEKPTLGIVFDAVWSVRAEKGIERPIFTISSGDVVPTTQTSALLITELKSSDGSVNMIPVNAEARITGQKESLAKLAQNLDSLYRTCPFDDLDYHPAEISVTLISDTEMKILAKVAGAQHGSAPHQNRANGANPVVSLTNFLAFLVDRDLIANNHNGEMCRFIRWAFGTRVFGENHPDLLYRFDTVFGERNGTTYALTKLQSDPQKISLYIDIRYAIGHHSKGWDGGEGTIEGSSLFQPIFDKLVECYQSDSGGAKVKVETKTFFGPDIRSLRNANLFRINMAYRSIMGDNCPMQAMGGATDAHGRLELVTAGALFTDNLGPPINYHGLDEGAPLTDLENSGKILLRLLLQELDISEKQELHHQEIHQSYGCCN